MNVISLWQPWATLMAIRAKKFETRSWGTEIRGQFGIHAAQKIVLEAWDVPQIRRALQQAGYNSMRSLPRGMIIATGYLEDVYRIEKVDDIYGTAQAGPHIIAGPEFKFGDYRNGRKAWYFPNMKELDTPIPVRGQQGIWQYRGGLYF